MGSPPPSPPSSSPPPSSPACLGCRLTGSASLLLLAALVSSARPGTSTNHRRLLVSVSCGLTYLSLARLAGLPPFPRDD